MFIFTETKTEADSAGEIQKNTSGAYNLSLSSKMYDKPIQKSCNIQTSARVNVGQIQIVFTVVHASCVQMHIKTGWWKPTSCHRATSACKEAQMNLAVLLPAVIHPMVYFPIQV